MIQSANDATWQDYERRAYELFCSTGHACERDVVIKGARGKHQIDVLVNLNISPRGHRWLIECKNWGRKVGKHEVEAFRTVIDDVGADHGYILSENGFQKGALEMARVSNISLASLSQLEQQFAQEQIDPLHQQSRDYLASVEEDDDTGNLDATAIVELRSTSTRSIALDIIEIHIFHQGFLTQKFLHRVISREDCKKWLTQVGTLRLSLPWDVPDLIPRGHSWKYLTANITNGLDISGQYTVIFRTLTGPVYVIAFVPFFK